MKRTCKPAPSLAKSASLHYWDLTVTQSVVTHRVATQKKGWSPVALKGGSLAGVQVGDPYPGQVPGCMGPLPIMTHLHLHHTDSHSCLDPSVPVPLLFSKTHTHTHTHTHTYTHITTHMLMRHSYYDDDQPLLILCFCGKQEMHVH